MKSIFCNAVVFLLLCQGAFLMGRNKGASIRNGIIEMRYVNFLLMDFGKKKSVFPLVIKRGLL